MRLSMWILAEWLRDYDPQVEIHSGNRSLLNARLYSSDLDMKTSTVYVGYLRKDQKQIICSNKDDTIIIERENHDVNDILNRILDAFDYYNEWADELYDMIRSDCTLEDLLNKSRSALKCMISLIDPSYYLIARVGQDLIDDHGSDKVTEEMPSLENILLLNEDMRSRANNRTTYATEVSYGGMRSVRNLFFRGTHRGWLVCQNPQGIYVRSDADIQDELGDMVEHWIEFHQEQSELMEKSGLLIQILKEEITRKDSFVHQRLESFGWRKTDEKQVFSLREEDSKRLSHTLDRKLDALGMSFVIHYQQNLFLILNCSATDRSAFILEFEALLRQTNSYCGASPSFEDIFDLRQYIEIARIAAEYGSAQKRIREIESAALPYYFKVIKDHSPVEIPHAVLQTLEEYDEKNGTEFSRTLEVYLQNERNYIDTAKKLHLHRNSLIYRVERIKNLTEVDLDDFETRLQLILSFELKKFTNQ